MSTQNIAFMIWPLSESDSPKGVKARMAMRVEASRGQRVCLTMARQASRLPTPRITPTMAPSTTTIALSTSIPRAMISAPSDNRCNSQPSIFIRMKVPSTVSSRVAPTIRPLRQPMVTSNAQITITTAAPRLSRKPSTARSTSLGWLYRFSTEIPAGRNWRSCSSRSCMRCPTSTTLTPAAKEMPTAIAGSPFMRSRCEGISS